jgi:alpha/beta hydrolase family protein
MTFPLRRLLAGVAASGLLSVGTLGAVWPGGADPHQAVAGPPGAAGWPAAVSAVAAGVAAPDPDSDSPSRVRRFVARLSERQRLELAARDPSVVGNLDGIPVALREAANQRAIEAAGGPDRPDGSKPKGRLLGYDPRGDGRVIEVFGDLDSARNVAVMVPGSGWTLRNVMTAGAGHGADPVAGALAIRNQIRHLDPGSRTAVVMWLGYDTPEGIDRQAARSERAIAGAVALRRFIAGLPTSAHVSLLCHSYGAVVCGRAAGAPGIDELVALAAPGLDVGSAAALHTSARLWAARVPDDPMRFVPSVRVGPFGHGADPTDPAFGARVLRTGTAHGHGGYYAPGTELLANLARIVLDRPSEVTLVDHDR